MARIFTPAKRKTCEAGHWIIAILVIISVVSAIASIVVGVLIVKPGLSAMNYENATCRVSSWRYLGLENCDCSGVRSDDPLCESSFPCYSIRVAYQPRRDVIPLNNTDENSFKHTAMLHETESELEGKHKQCSFINCDQDDRRNKFLAESFKRKYGQPGEFYLCKYNPYDLKQVIVFQRFNKVQVLVSLIIPPSLFVISLVILIIFCVIRGKRKSDVSSRSINLSAPVRTYLSYDMPAFVPDDETENPPETVEDKSNGDAEDHLSSKYPTAATKM